MQHKTYTDIYDRRGGRYHEAMARWPAARSPEFRALAEVANVQAEPSPLVVDVPSGGGYLQGYLPSSARVISVDPARNFLDSGTHQDDFQVVCAPHDSISLSDGCADYVLSLAGIHHLDDQAAAVQEWFRLLRPGGTLVIGDAESGSATARFLDGVVGRFNSMGYEGLYLDGDFKQVLLEAGYEAVDFGPRAYGWDFDSRRDMLDFCRTLFSMDLEPDDHTLLEAIESTVGFKETATGCSLNWELFFFRAQRPVALSTATAD